jgi:hypothetical protein
MLLSYEMRRSGHAHAGPVRRSFPLALAGPAYGRLEILAGIAGSLVTASFRGGASWTRLLLNRMRVAALLPAAGDAMIGELFPEERQRPVPQFDPVAGAQWLTAGCPSTRPGAWLPRST